MSDRDLTASPELGVVSPRSTNEEQDEPLSEELGESVKQEETEEDTEDGREDSISISEPGRSPISVNEAGDEASEAELEINRSSSHGEGEIEFSFESCEAFTQRPLLCKHLTPFSSCESSSCTCRGFVCHWWRSRRDLFRVSNRLSSTPIEEQCARCGHQMSVHLSGIRKLSVDDVDRLAELIDDVDIMHDVMEEAHPHVASHVLTLFQRSLAALRLLNRSMIDDPWLPFDGSPPCERPSVETLVRHYLSSFNTKKADSVQLAMLYADAGRFLTEFNKWRPPYPEFYEMCHSDKDQYMEFLDAWTVCCALPEIFSTLQQHEPVHVFGIRTLIMYARFIKRTAKDTEDEERNLDGMLIDPMSSLSLRQFSRGFFRYLYEARTRNPEKLKYIKPVPARGMHWPYWDKLSDCRHGAIGPESRLHLAKVHARLKEEAEETKHGYIPRDTMLKVCVQAVVNERATEGEPEDELMKETSRGEAAKIEEAEGVIRFVLIKHDTDELVAREHLAWLLQLQTLFAIQLPKMPQEYITRLVFDDRHRNLALVKKDKGVIGGICFRPFREQSICEIVFCAITANEQVKGYGSHMMNHLKELMVNRCGVDHLLTFADEFATGYFTKQGFNRKLGIPKEKYEGILKEYDGATLMGCPLMHGFKYTDFAGFARMTRDLHAAMHDVVFSEHSEKASRKFGGIEHVFREHEANSSDPLPLTAIPGLNDFAMKYNQPVADKQLLKKMRCIMKRLAEDEHAWPFVEPVSAEEVPEYAALIAIPTDMSMINQRIDEKYYVHERLFIGDLYRIFHNCYTFNGSETIYYLCGYKLNQLAIELVTKEFPQSDLQMIMPQAEPTYVG